MRANRPPFAIVGDTESIGGTIAARMMCWRKKEQRADITSNALEEFIQRIKDGKPQNNAQSGAESTLTAILGRMATMSGMK